MKPLLNYSFYFSVYFHVKPISRAAKKDSVNRWHGLDAFLLPRRRFRPFTIGASYNRYETGPLKLPLKMRTGQFGQPHSRSFQSFAVVTAIGQCDFSTEFRHKFRGIKSKTTLSIFRLRTRRKRNVRGGKNGVLSDDADRLRVDRGQLFGQKRFKYIMSFLFSCKCSL